MGFIFFYYRSNDVDEASNFVAELERIVGLQAGDIELRRYATRYILYS